MSRPAVDHAAQNEQLREQLRAEQGKVVRLAQRCAQLERLLRAAQRPRTGVSAP